MFFAFMFFAYGSCDMVYNVSLQWALWSVRGLFDTSNSASLNVICIQAPPRQEVLQLSWSPVR